MNALHGLSAWNKACELAVQSCSAVRDCGDRNFRDEITRASLSVPSNIAEGYERDSKKQFARYLRMARDSCAELRTQLYITAQLDLITVQKSTELMQDSMEITRMLRGLIEWCDAGADPAVTRLRSSGEKALKAQRLHDAKSALNSRFPLGGSSNGRTADSDSASGGSSPSPPAI